MASSFGAPNEENSTPVHTNTTLRRSASSTLALTASEVLPRSSLIRTASGAFGSQETPRSSCLTCSAMSTKLSVPWLANVLTCAVSSRSCRVPDGVPPRVEGVGAAIRSA